MSLQYLGLDEINGPLVFLDHVEGVGYEEMVEIRCKDGSSAWEESCSWKEAVLPSRSSKEPTA